MAAAARWQLRTRLLCRHFVSPPAAAFAVRPPCPPIESPVLGSHGDDEELLGEMDLMAVPKKKISVHKRRIRNAPKALKPIPVIAQCRVCGRYKLPMHFCCKPREKFPPS